MNYDEYLKCAEKHLKSCQQILDGLKSDVDNKEAYLDIWYLSGYIIEGCTVYSVYKLYGWNPPSSVKDIKIKYDKIFSQKTRLDFFHHRLDKNTKKLVFPEGLIIYSIQGHDFHSIIRDLLNVNPTFSDFPIMGSGKIDKDVEVLVNNWKPDIRYWYKEDELEDIPKLTSDLLKRLINTCYSLYNKIMIFV